MLVEKTVSQYLFERAMTLNGLGAQIKQVRYINTSDSDIAYAFLSDSNKPAVVTWKPLVSQIMNVPVTPEGGLTFQDGVSGQGKYVELRAEMDVLAVISNCPQLNNPCNAYNPTPIRVLIWDPTD